MIAYFHLLSFHTHEREHQSQVRHVGHPQCEGSIHIRRRTHRRTLDQHCHARQRQTVLVLRNACNFSFFRCLRQCFFLRFLYHHRLVLQRIAVPLFAQHFVEHRFQGNALHVDSNRLDAFRHVAAVKEFIARLRRDLIDKRFHRRVCQIQGHALRSRLGDNGHA